MALEIPDLFTQVSPELFRPLSGPLAPLYWRILATFYAHEFEREPFFLERSKAVDTIEQILGTNTLWQERREAVLADDLGPVPPDSPEDGPLRATARRVLSRLEASGWIHFEYRAGAGDILNFHPRSARLLETLLRIARDEQPVFQGYAHSIASLLKPEAFAGRPGVSLTEAKRTTLEMVRELKILNRNIFAFTQRMVQEAVTAAKVLEHGLDKYRGAVLANYHRLKTVDNLYKWRGEILHRLDVIERDTLALSAATRWYAEQHQLDSESAAQRVNEDLSVMRQQFDSLPDITDDIDERNARFSGIALRKLMYLLRQDRRTEGDLQRIIDALSSPESPELELDVFKCELLGSDFLFTPRKAKPKVVPQPLPRPPPPDPELRDRVAERLKREYSRRKIDALVAELLRGRPHATLADAPLEGDRDYVRLMYIAAYGLDGASPFRFQLPASPEPHERRGPYGFPRGRLERRKRGNP